MRYDVLLWKDRPFAQADVEVVVEADGIDAAIGEAMRWAGLSSVPLAWVFPHGTEWHGEGRFQVHCSPLAQCGQGDG